MTIKKIIKKSKNIIKNPVVLFKKMGNKGYLNFLNDALYLKLIYRMIFKKKLNLDNPQTYNEKLQWLKLYDHNPLYTKLVDKYEVREYIADMIGEEYLIPLLGVWDSVESIDWESLPNEFVIKTTHDSGGVVICKDKTNFDIQKAEETLIKSLTTNYYYGSREWPYKNVKPKIIAEKLMIDESGYELKDYKFFCFNGEPKFMFIASNRGEDTRFDFYDNEFNHLPVIQGHPNSDKNLNMPKNYNEMLELAQKLSEKFPHVRVDFYNINGEIYFGELTFYHFSGFVEFKPEKYDKQFGALIQLQNNTN